MPESKIITLKELMGLLRNLLDRAHQIRENIPTPINSHDARQECLFTIQKILESTILSIGSINYVDRSGTSLNSIVSAPYRNNTKIFKDFSNWINMTVLTFIHFRTESFFFDILKAIDSGYAERKFNIHVKNILSEFPDLNAVDTQNFFDVISVVRNSYHNNHININYEVKWEIPYNGKVKKYNFKKNKAVGVSMEDVMIFIDYLLGIIEHISLSEKVRKLPIPIPETRHTTLSLVD